MRRWLLIGFGCLVVLGAAGFFAGPPLVERYAERKLRARLDGAGMGGEWAELSWSLSDGLVLTDAKFWRGHQRFQTSRLQVQVANRRALFGELAVERIEVGSWTALVVAKTPKAGGPQGSGGGESRLMALLAEAPELVVAPGRVKVRRDGENLASVEVRTIQAQASAEGIAVEASGAWTIRQPGVDAKPWKARLAYDPEVGTASVDLSGEDTLVEVRHGPLDISVQGVGMTQAAGRRTFTARGVRGRGGPLEGQVASARLEKRFGEWTVVLADGSLRIERGEGGGEGGGGVAGALPTAPPFPVEVENVDVELAVRGKELEGHLRWARAAESRWSAVVDIGSGAAAVELDLIPGTLQPRMVSVRMDEVDTEELQAVLRRHWRRPLGRRAALAGKLSGWLTLFSAPEWPERPLDLDGPLRLEAQLQLDDGVVDWDGVHEVPLDGIDGQAAVSVRWDPDQSFRAVAQLGHNALRGYVALDALDLSGTPQAELVVSVDPIDCQAALDSLPRSLLGPYQKARVRGHITPWLQVNVPMKRPIGLKLRFEGFLGRCEVLHLNAAREAWPDVRILGRKADSPASKIDDVGWLYSSFVMDVREGTSKPVQIGPGLDSYVPITSLPRYVGGAAYLSEEMEFYGNGAISAGLILRGLRLNLEKKRFVYGGSTVTQQLVKNLFLSRKKTLVRKFREALVAGRIVDELSKDRVLELYLNCIEFGPNIYGIGPAAQYYFGKDARELSPKEAVFLAMLKPAPRHGGIMKRRGYSANYPWWKDRYTLLMQRLVDRGYITEEDAEAEKPYQLYWDKGEYLGSKTALRDPFADDPVDIP